ncbi:hypothetical protein [Rhodococcus sp. NPDC058639]|uniref:hypothetical protein n=1 Tax=unclassified Rhodococcus (in: high G+C Gram-positive bacteria) TaxID=192944 RepID=UPI0036471C96
MQSVLWALLAWCAVSVTTALVVGRVIAIRDRKEAPSFAGNDEDSRDAQVR